MAQIISTKKNKILTDRIDRNRNVHMYGEDCIFNNFGGLNIVVKTGTTNTIEIQPGLYQIGGTIAQSEQVENMVLSGQPNGDYSVVAKMNLKIPQAQIVVQSKFTSIKRQNLVDLEQGERDFVLATFTLSNGNILNLKMVPDIRIEKNYNLNELGTNVRDMKVQINGKVQNFKTIQQVITVASGGKATIPFPANKIVSVHFKPFGASNHLNFPLWAQNTPIHISGDGVGTDASATSTITYVQAQWQEVNNQVEITFTKIRNTRSNMSTNLGWGNANIEELYYTVAETD